MCNKLSARESPKADVPCSNGKPRDKPCSYVRPQKSAQESRTGRKEKIVQQSGYMVSPRSDYANSHLSREVLFFHAIFTDFTCKCAFIMPKLTDSRDLCVCCGGLNVQLQGRAPDCNSAQGRAMRCLATTSRATEATFVRGHI